MFFAIWMIVSILLMILGIDPIISGFLGLVVAFTDYICSDKPKPIIVQTRK